jgi:hypothetical protein
MFLALRELRRERWRFVLLTGAVGLLVLLPSMSKVIASYGGCVAAPCPPPVTGAPKVSLDLKPRDAEESGDEGEEPLSGRS